MTYNAISIADEFLRLGKERGKLFTPMELLKLVYIAHGWYLAYKNKALINDRIEAWKFGPVIPNLYHATKKFGRNPIPLEQIDTSLPSRVDSDTKAFLSSVLEAYKDFNGIALSNLTHQPGSPWFQVYNPNELGIEIPEPLISQHYKQIFEQRSEANG
nr:type II toxin-antitoxin system antitoxin SocA domain-containing protein [uncultured Cohaesibacter sp.]